VKKLTLYQTDAKTFRVLVDGSVNPLLVGFNLADDAIEKAGKMFPGVKVEVPLELRHFVKGTYTLFRSLEGFYYLRDDLGVPFAATKGETPMDAITYFKPGEINLEIPVEVAILMSPADVLYFSADFDASRRPTDDQFFQGGYILGGMFRETQADYDNIRTHLKKMPGVAEFLDAVAAYEASGCKVDNEALNRLASVQFTHLSGFLVWPLTVK
jgi:hypothetical protein